MKTGNVIANEDKMLFDEVLSAIETRGDLSRMPDGDLAHALDAAERQMQLVAAQDVWGNVIAMPAHADFADARLVQRAVRAEMRIRMRLSHEG